jgi:quercetin dioxygenase-like cupin family protein
MLLFHKEPGREKTMFGTKSELGYTEMLKGIKVKTVAFGDKTMMTEFVMEKGAELGEHAHAHEQTGYLVKGRIRLYVGDSSKELGAHDSWCVPSNVKHRADILEDAIAIEVFSPYREEYARYAREEDVIR